MFNKIYDFIKENIKDLLFFFFWIVFVYVICFAIKIPYEVEMPGGTIDLGNRVTIDGEKTEIEGSFNMAYVGVVYGSIPHVLLGLVLPDWEVIKESDYLSENETVEDLNNREKVYLEQSKNQAMVAALVEAGIEYEITNEKNNVIYIDEEAETTLKVGDNIIECEGEEVKSIDSVIALIKEKKKGDIINLKVLRDDKEKEVTAKVYETEDGPKIGILSITTYDVVTEKVIEIESKSSESGPSGGMMMALMIYNALTEQDLTNGKKIVGTGTIDEYGNVGEIGGVKYKLMGAVKDKADVFLVPKDNYEEAMEVKEEKDYDIEIVSVEKLVDAINYLEGDDNKK